MVKKGIEILLRLKDQASKKLQKTTKGIGSQFKKMGTSLKAHWIGVTAGIVGAIATIKKAWDTAKFGAAVKQTEQTFKAVVSAFGIDADELIKHLEKASGQTINSSNIMKAAITAIYSGVDPSQLKNLMESARAMARVAGQSVEDTFNMVVGAIVGGYMVTIKRTYGINVSLKDANEKMAASLGKVVKELSEEEKTRGLVNAVLDKTLGLKKSMDLSHRTELEDIQKVSAEWLTLKENIAKKFSPVVITALKFWGELFSDKGIKNVTPEMKQLVDRLNEATAELDKMTKHRGNYHKVDELIAEAERERLALIKQIHRFQDEEIEKAKQLKKEKEDLIKREKEAAALAAKRAKEAEERKKKAAEQLEAEKKFADEKAELLEQLQDKIYELTHSETEVRKRELEKQIADWIAIYGSDGEMMKIIKEYYKKKLEEIKKGEDEAKKAAEGDKGDKKKKEYTADQLIEMQKHTLTDPGRAEWARKEMKRRRRESILEKKDSPERRRKLAEIDAPTMSEEWMEALHNQGGGAEGKEQAPKEREAIRKGADSQTTKNETISKLAGYIETNSTTLGDILKICTDAVDKLKEHHGDIDTLKTQVANLTEGGG